MGETTLADWRKDNPGKCGRRKKVCRQCGFRWKGGDKTTVCDRCGEDRRCRGPIKGGTDTCRMHGGDGSPGPGPKYVLGDKLNHGINRLLQHPELHTLSVEMAANSTRVEQLLRRTEESDTAGFGELVDKGMNMVQSAIIEGDRGKAQKGIDLIREARAKERSEFSIWYELREHLKLQTAMASKQQDMMLKSEIMISVVHLREVLTTFQRIVFRVVKSPEDRKWVIQQMKQFYQEDE